MTEGLHDALTCQNRGHPKSSETSPFDRAHMTSYSTCICRLCTGWSCSNFAMIFGVRKLESLGYCAALLAWS